MASASRTANDPLTVSTWAADGDVESKSERYLARRLAAAGADYKGVALTTFLLAAGVGVMLWLGGGVLAEHWLMPGGLPASVRWAWLATGLVALVAAAVRWVLPLIRYRVNLVYAARMLEQEHPGLHNDVVNAVLAQAHADESTPLVVKSLRRRAARQLKGVAGDGVVDRGPALRLAFVLAALIAAACLYELVAPKSLLVSAARLVAPWLRVSAPSRVRISPPTLSWSLPGGASAAADRSLPVVNGVATLVRGRQLVVSSEIDGLSGDEKPTLLVAPVADDASSPPDGWRTPLLPAAGGGYTAVLPDASRGLDQSVDIVIAAGDARSERLRVAVVDEPAMLVREVHYRYPPHTGQAPETIPWQGDIRGVEGTQVTVLAECNHPLEAAWIDLGPDGKRDVPLTIGQKDLARGRGTFTLKLTADRTVAEHGRYRLLFQPKAASLSQREPTVVDKMEYRIEVIPDLAPEIAIEEPAERVVRVPPDAPVTVRLRAVDPDFGLASVTVETRVAAGGERPGQELLVGPRKNFRGAATLIPAALGAGPGQELEYRGVAKDTRPEQPNVATTEWYKLRIDASAPPRQPPPADDREAPGDGDVADGSQEGDAPRGQPEQGGGKDAGGEEAGESGKGAADGGPGDAGADAQGRQNDGGKSPDSGDGTQGGPKGTGGTKDTGQPPSKRQTDPQPGDEPGKPQEGDQQGSADGGKPNDDSGKAGRQPGQQQQPGSQDGAGGEPEGRGGNQQSGGEAGSRPDAGAGSEQRPAGAGGPGEGQPGAKKSDGGGASSGDGTRDRAEGNEADRDGSKAQPFIPPGLGKGLTSTREPIASDGTADGDAMEKILEHRRRSEQGAADEDRAEAGEGQPGEDQPGEGQPGEGKPGEGKPGERKPGDSAGEGAGDEQQGPLNEAS